MQFCTVSTSLSEYSIYTWSISKCFPIELSKNNKRKEKLLFKLLRQQRTKTIISVSSRARFYGSLAETNSIYESESIKKRK